jgi:sugar lactone lactonase YvrE
VLLVATAAPCRADTLTPGAIYVTNTIIPGNSDVGQVLRIDPVTGAQTVISQGNNLIDPYGIAIGSNGNLLVTDLSAGTNSKGAIISVNPTTGAQSILSQGGFFAGRLEAVAVNKAGTIFAADFIAGQVYTIDPVTGKQTVLSQGNLINRPEAITVDASGRLLVANRVGGTGDHGTVIAVDPVTGAQQLISQDQNFAGNPLSLGGGLEGITVDAAGRILVTDEGAGGSGSVIAIDPATGIQTVVSTGQNFMGGEELLAVDLSGRILVIDFNAGTGSNGAVIAVDPVTGMQTFLSQDQNFFIPVGIVVVPAAAPAVPEPSSLALLALGGGALAGWRRWRKRTAA